jgi:hypothetical protein
VFYIFTPMKFHALILSIAILVYIAENVQIPLMATGHKKVTCCKKMMSCKERMKMGHNMNDKSNSCGGNSCVNCPFVNVFTLQPLYSDILIQPAKKYFYPMETNIVPGVYWQVWRPPDVS